MSKSAALTDKIASVANDSQKEMINSLENSPEARGWTLEEVRGRKGETLQVVLVAGPQGTADGFKSPQKCIKHVGLRGGVSRTEFDPPRPRGRKPGAKVATPAAA